VGCHLESHHREDHRERDQPLNFRTALNGQNTWLSQLVAVAVAVAATTMAANYDKQQQKR